MRKIPFTRWSRYSYETWLIGLAKQGWKLDKIKLGIVHHFIKSEPQNTYYLRDFIWKSSSAYEERMIKQGWEIFEKDNSGGYLWKRDEGENTFPGYAILRKKQDRAQNIYVYFAFFIICLLGSIFLSTEPFVPIGLAKYVSVVMTITSAILVVVNSFSYLNLKRSNF